MTITEAEPTTSTPEIPTSFAAVEQNFALHLPGYEARPQQQLLARSIEVAIETGVHLFAQAGCGTGKSLGGVTPMILAAVRDDKRVIVATATKALQEQYCVAPDTKILTADLRYIRAADVQVGMDLVGFDEERNGTRRRYQTAKVENVTLIQRPCYRLTFDDGTVITSSVEHRWLARRGGIIKWMTTEQLCVATAAREGTKVIRLMDVWDTDTSYEAGYLAAAWDGEGHLTQRDSQQLANGVINKLGFAQRDNEMFTQVTSYLSSLGFKYSERVRTDINAIDINNRPELVRFLGQIRPARLLPKFRVEGLGSINTQDGARLVEKEFVGVQDVMAIKTSTGTFVAEGLASHNCSKDMPFLTEHSGIPFTWALLKGRSNYVCQVKLLSDEAERLTSTAMIRKELKENPEHTGDFEHFSSAIPDLELSKLSTSSNECPGKMECPFGEICYAEKARSAALRANLVITNTAMLMTDRVIYSKTAHRDNGPVEMLGPVDMVLFDEAHELPEIAASNLGFDFTAQGIATFARDAISWAALQGEDIANAGDFIGDTLKRLGPVVLEQVGNALNMAWFSQNFEPFMDVRDAVESVRVKLLQIPVVRDKETQQARLKMLLTRSGNIISNLQDMVSAEDHEAVRWVETYEVRGEKRWRMRTSPVDIAPFMKQWVWDQYDNAVLMSATLTSGKDAKGNKDFTYMKRNLGLWDAETIDVGTPFDLGKQGLMFVPGKTVASPKNYGVWSSYAAMTTLRLIDEAKGGALLLYTSRRAMETAYETLAEQLQDRGYTTLMQGDGRTNKQLAQTFKDDTHSVLFAMKSFFVGVDVPGDACRLVVIDKLPFPVPTDPVFAAKSLKEEREGRFPFNTLSIPIMILILEQAIGRLIRSKVDRGVVAVLDSRLSSEKWGHRIVAALPDFPVTVDLNDVRDFYQGKDFG